MLIARRASVLALPAACTALAYAALTAPAMAAETQPRPRVVHVSATLQDGTPATDLTAADFDVKENGRTQEIISVRRASMPLRVAIVVSDAGSGAFQLGVAHLLQDLIGHGEFAITSVVVQPERVMPYSSNIATLKTGLARVGSRTGSRTGGGQLLEAINDATRDIRADGKRGIIVVLRVGGEGPTDMQGSDVRDRLRKSGAVLYAVGTVNANRATPSQARGTDALSLVQGQFDDANIASGALNLQSVLGDGSRESGGRYVEVVSTTMVTTIRQIASEILSQYEIQYARPAGAKASDRISISSPRRDVTILAPTRLAN